ncbi:MAG: discoidin domain-containing protein [Opitutales bacterium]|nr:discoidin domain-containing protein [Opitutales bacterium]
MKKSLLAVLALTLAFSAFADKKLVLEIPPAQLVGTPAPIKLENLETKVVNPTPMVPNDVKNIAKGKKVTSSDDFPLIGDMELITDGDKSAAEGCFVELMNGVQWVQVDLEKESEIFGIAMWLYHSQERAYKDVIVQVSNDAEFKKDVKTLFNCDNDNSSKLGKGNDRPWVQTNEGKLIVPEKPVKARFVRIYSNGNTSNDANHFIEVEVFGR